MTEIAFWKREREALIGQMTVLKRVLFLHLFHNDCIYSPPLTEVHSCEWHQEYNVLCKPGFPFLIFYWNQVRGSCLNSSTRSPLLDNSSSLLFLCRLQPEQHFHFWSNHPLCSLQGILRENDIWTLRSAPLLHFQYHHEPKHYEGRPLFKCKTDFFIYILVLAWILKAISLFACKWNLKSFMNENNQRGNNSAKPCLDFKTMLKWIIMKEFLEYEALSKYFALWQPLLTSLPIIFS